MNCLHSIRTKAKLQSHIKVCKSKVFCNIVMPSRDTKTLLSFNQYKRSSKIPFIICANLQCLIEEIDR